MFIKGTLLRDRNFRNLWIGQTISMFGSQITFFALPLIATITLKSSTSDLGILRAFEYLPALIFGLFMGVFVDRFDKKKLLLFSDIFRAILLLCIPLLFFIDLLNIYWLWFLGFLLGFFAVLFEIGYMAYLPSVISKEKLIKGNSLFEMSNSIFTISGPSLAGLLIHIVSAPFAMIIDSISYLLSAIFLRKVKVDNNIIKNTFDKKSKNLILEIIAGFNCIKESNFLRVIICSSGLTNMANAFLFPVFMVYISKDLNYSPFLIGLIFSFGGFGALFGAFLSNSIVLKFGIGKTIFLSILITFFSYLIIPFVGDLGVITMLVLFISQFLNGLATTIRNINQISVRMSITKEEFLGRVNSIFKFILLGVVPLGSLLGGFLGEVLENEGALVAGSLIFVPSLLVILQSKLFRIKSIEELVADD